MDAVAGLLTEPLSFFSLLPCKLVSSPGELYFDPLYAKSKGHLHSLT